MSVSVLNTDAALSGKTIMAKEVSETVSGVKTFSAAPVFSVAPAVNAGLQFPATQNASADVNCLDDYEEGSWTPTITSSGGGTPTYSTQSGLYIKIGKKVFVGGRVVLATKGTLGAGVVSISGLPFSVISSGVDLFTADIKYFTGMSTSVASLGGYFGAATSGIVVTCVIAAGGTNSSNIGVSDIGTTVDFMFSGFYVAAS